jgi:hypothetical protein
MTKPKKMVFALIVGNRGFFPDILTRDGRENMIRFWRPQHQRRWPGA